MEPRWNNNTWPHEGVTYLGGTNAFDLWLDETRDVRVVNDILTSGWDWFYWARGSEHYVWGTQDMPYVDHDKVLEEVLTYLRIFAPWVEEEMTKGEEDYHKE